MSVFVVPKGMPLSIFEDKYARRLPEGRKQTWEERVTEVVEGNVALAKHFKGLEVSSADKVEFLELMKRGVLPMSGRHLQHGDKGQIGRLGENYTNCSTSAFSFLKFWLLMKGSGVGRLYDEDVCLVDWSKAPKITLALDQTHPDWTQDLYDRGVISRGEARFLAKNALTNVLYHAVEDSAEGWAEVIQILESEAYYSSRPGESLEDSAVSHCIFDFSKVRGKGSPIRGQQNRPASGPVPFMTAVQNVSSITAQIGMSKWEQAMRIDHELAACVVVGGIRRSARIALKTWDDPGIEDFILIKNSGDLWSANNSVVTTDEFWTAVRKTYDDHQEDTSALTEKEKLATAVFYLAATTAYTKNTGEPSFFNSDNISKDCKGLENVNVNYLSRKVRSDLKFSERTDKLVNDLLEKAVTHKTLYICNPCGEIPLAMFGGYCVIGDICAARANNTEDLERAAVAAAKALVRVNLMPFLYEGEVKRTNRIGVSLTGLHEFAFNVFGLTWDDLTGPLEDVQHFWNALGSARASVESALERYCAELGVNMPSTYMTIKPSGTVSKVLDCTEGAHLPAYGYYMRWVMFPSDGEEFSNLRARGYPTKDVGTTYYGQSIVGFPTRTRIAELMGDKVTKAGEASIESQYVWIQRLEEYWLGEEEQGGQVSYTLKFSKDAVDLTDFLETLLKYQPKVRCCAIMPQVDLSAYAYQPEEKISKEEYIETGLRIVRVAKESYDKERLTCEGGACPIEMDLA